MSEKDFDRGYFCAVAALLKNEGCVTTAVKELFKNGGAGWCNADNEDIQLFHKHDLLRGGRLGA